MSINIFEEERIGEVIERFGSSRKMAVFVGAGSSIEAGLPTWEELIKRLLDRAAREANLFSKPKDRRAWVKSMLQVESLIGAASVVEGLLNKHLITVLRQELYAGQTKWEKNLKARDYFPGPIANQIAYLRLTFEGQRRQLHIFTTNYDDLLEVALQNQPKLAKKYTIYPYVRPGKEPDHPLKVRHLHGYLGRQSKTLRPVTLTEHSYYLDRMDNFWQEPEVVSELNETPCLFLGTSLTDPNITRYLYEAKGEQRHAVIFVRQAETYLVPASVRRVREAVAIERWSKRLDVIFVDHYSDVSQLLHEIANRRRTTKGRYTPLTIRARRYLTNLETEILKPDSDEEFLERQKELHEVLVDILDQACAVMSRKKKQKLDLTTELGLSMALWLLDISGRKLTAWATTDRIHCNVAALQTVELNPNSRWVAAKAFCSGRYTEEKWDYSNSRWSYIIGIPLWTKGGHIPVGALTLTTRTSANRTKLAQMNPSQRASFAETLTAAVLEQLGSLSTG
jgi:hypothetical protein